MSIDPLIDPDAALIARAAARPEVVAAVDAATAATARLRFHEGLRRGWEEARAEAAVREAAALSILLGARTSVDDLRLLSLSDARGADAQTVPVDPREDPLADGEGGSSPSEGAGPADRSRDPAEDLALGLWRSQWGLASGFDPINTRAPVRRRPRPLPALTAAIHRDICSALIASGRLGREGVAVPADPAAMARAAAYIRAPLPAVACAGALVAHFRVREVFAPASAGVGGALARWVLVTRGVDPTGVAAISAVDALDPAAASRALAGWVSADEEGVARWLVHVAGSVEYGAEVGRDIALRVQAGRLGSG
ncbi:hypothetical protein M3T53_01115 [Actinomyces sp. B33]|uniref:hypothetical protein n=1 Tax=Actinomyces sp. B33 TaxID=2942131 RepID=UPI0023409D89|nr:hypothetical protein [Actinomyces sp. B33]MDC4232315.1 hypothetical protein [Actinomyces sp. B33]